MSTTTTIAAAQIDITFADRERNLSRMLDVLTDTAKNGAKLTVFPEAALSGYCFDNLDEARGFRTLLSHQILHAGARSVSEKALSTVSSSKSHGQQSFGTKI